MRPNLVRTREGRAARKEPSTEGNRGIYIEAGKTEAGLVHRSLALGHTLDIDTVLQLNEQVADH